jgi:multicomponent Na+:H+ antiporter subunit B
LKIVALVTVMLCGAVLLYGTAEFPAFGDPASPAATHVSPHYIEKAVEETSVPNLVTAVLADYRSFDTLFETTVVFSAAIACFFLLRVVGEDDSSPPEKLYRHLPTGITLRIKSGGKEPVSPEFERIDGIWIPQDVIIKTTTRLIIPFIQLFGLYVIAHGHHSPGGGFQGGVILGASIILYAISQNLRLAIGRMGETVAAIFCAAGVFIYAGAGALCLLLGVNFLDYSGLAPLFGVDAIHARSLGILVVEIGVGLAVMSAMVWIYYNLASMGRHQEGL